jgi:hypothetical protein
MTQILNSEIQVRIQLEKTDADNFLLHLRKGKQVKTVVLTQVEATELVSEFNLLITKNQ